MSLFYLRKFICFVFFDKKRHAVEVNIKPSFKTLKLLSANVFPVDVISVIISEDPIKGYVSVAPRLGISLYCVTPFEIKKSLVKFGYFVAILNLLFLFNLMSNETSSKSATV